jgi:hypothetical protein|tara:strand:+ start:7989 stop:8267 length:279 start_codon:yes stop_codon:yes gene_type:complete
MNHHKWLKKRGLLPEQIKKRKKVLGSPNTFPDYSTVSFAPLSNSIPANGTKNSDTSKADFCNDNYAMVPAYNKGPIMMVTKEDLKQGAGRKL